MPEPTHPDAELPMLRAWVYENTHGWPPLRECVPGSDEKWDGYLLGVEEAIQAAEAWMSEQVSRGRLLPLFDTTPGSTPAPKGEGGGTEERD